MAEPVAVAERPMTASQVARALGLALSSVKAIPPAELPFFRVGSRGDRRYHRADVDQYIGRRRSAE